jgi:hypothetical protein
MPAALPIPTCWTCRPCASGSNDVTTPTPATPKEIVRVNLVADIAGVAPYDGLEQINVRGMTTISDGMGGIWWYLSDSSDTADGYYVIAPTSGNGRYHKQV